MSNPKSDSVKPLPSSPLFEDESSQANESCPRCAKSFVCNNKTFMSSGCWCYHSKGSLSEITAGKYAGKCLCPSCLHKILQSRNDESL